MPGERGIEDRIGDVETQASYPGVNRGEIRHQRGVGGAFQNTDGTDDDQSPTLRFLASIAFVDEDGCAEFDGQADGCGFSGIEMRQRKRRRGGLNSEPSRRRRDECPHFRGRFRVRHLGGNIGRYQHMLKKCGQYFGQSDSNENVEWRIVGDDEGHGLTG